MSSHIHQREEQNGGPRPNILLASQLTRTQVNKLLIINKKIKKKTHINKVNQNKDQD